MDLKTPIGRLRLVAIIEGISYLLFAITMPLKYQLEILWPNQVIGMVHGILFIIYCYLVILVAVTHKWKFTPSLLAFLAGFFPFATFIVEAKMLRKEQ